MLKIFVIWRFNRSRFYCTAAKKKKNWLDFGKEIKCAIEIKTHTLEAQFPGGTILHPILEKQRKTR